jgi:hypothetical protein
LISSASLQAEFKQNNRPSLQDKQMTYATIFSMTASAERFALVSGKVAVRVFGFSVWAIALTALGFANGCRNSLELGKDARDWWESFGRDWAIAEIGPCIAVAIAVSAWLVENAQKLSVAGLPIILASNDHFWAEVWVDYLAAGDRVVKFVDRYLMGA